MNHDGSVPDAAPALAAARRGRWRLWLLPLWPALWVLGVAAFSGYEVLLFKTVAVTGLVMNLI